MKSIVQFKEMTTSEREKNLKARAQKTRLDEIKKEISKIIVAAEEAGDFGKGEMNSWSLRVTGMELRREVQGTYEYANVLRGIRSNELPFSEEEFDKAPSFGLIKLAGFMNKKDSEKVAAALEIIRSKKDVTNRLKELTQKPKAEKPKAEKPEAEKPEAEKPEAEKPEAVSLNSGSEPEAPKGSTFFVPEGQSILNVPEVQARILEDLRKAPDGESCQAYFDFLKGLVAHLHSRWEVVEAEESKAAKREAIPA